MSSRDETNWQMDQTAIENARVGYQVATNLWVYEGTTFWSKFNALLVANSIVLGSIGLSMTTSRHVVVLSIGMPIVGIFLCGFWLLLAKRSFDYYKYWIFSAREIEERYLSNAVQTVSRGGKFADGGKAEMEIAGEKKPLPMSCWARLLRIEWASYLIIGLFFAIYMIILIINITNYFVLFIVNIVS